MSDAPPTLPPARPTQGPPPAAVPLLFRARHRLGHAREFDAVYAAKARKARGPLTLYSLPNQLSHPRLGLSVSGRVGNAVTRNRIKRLLREALRLQQHTLPSLDLVVQVRPHTALPFAAYAQLLAELAGECAREWERRGPRTAAVLPKTPGLGVPER